MKKKKKKKIQKVRRINPLAKSNEIISNNDKIKDFLFF